MAEIFPQNPPQGIPRSEMKVFAALRDGLPEDFVVFHGQRINTTRSDRYHQRPEEQEIDFIIFHPYRGYLVLEVKGGGIEAVGLGRDHPGKECRVGQVFAFQEMVIGLIRIPDGELPHSIDKIPLGHRGEQALEEPQGSAGPAGGPWAPAGPPLHPFGFRSSCPMTSPRRSPCSKGPSREH